MPLPDTCTLSGDSVSTGRRIEHATPSLSWWSEMRRRLSACVRVHAAHFKHEIWQFWADLSWQLMFTCIGNAVCGRWRPARDLSCRPLGPPINLLNFIFYVIKLNITKSAYCACVLVVVDFHLWWLVYPFYYLTYSLCSRLDRKLHYALHLSVRPSVCLVRACKNEGENRKFRFNFLGPDFRKILRIS